MAKVRSGTRTKKALGSSPYARSLRVIKEQVGERTTFKDGKLTTEPIFISRRYLAPLGADSERVKRIGTAVKKVIGERPSAKAK